MLHLETPSKMTRSVQAQGPGGRSLSALGGLSPSLVASLIAFIAFLIVSFSANAATLKNIPPTPHGAPAGTPIESLALAIQFSAEDYGWKITDEKPGELIAEILVRGRHRAVVAIGYDESNYWIDYVTSENLNYNPHEKRRPGRHGSVIKGPRIHQNYNSWVRNLSNRIVLHMKAPPEVSVPSEEAEPAPPPAAEEE